MSGIPAWYPGADSIKEFYGYAQPTRPHLPELIYLKVANRLDWPSYFDGAFAPHMTIAPRLADDSLAIRQHYTLDRTARFPTGEMEMPPHIAIVLLGTSDQGRVNKWTEQGRAFVNWTTPPAAIRAELVKVLEFLVIRCGCSEIGGRGLNLNLIRRDLARATVGSIHKLTLPSPAAPPTVLPDKPMTEMTPADKMAKARAAKAAKRAAKLAALEALAAQVPAEPAGRV